MGATDVKNVGNTVKELLAMGETGKAVDLLIASGKGHHVTIGALTTPIVGGGAGTTLLIDQPQGLINIGSNLACIPVRIAVQCEVGIVSADSEVSEILVAVDVAKSADGLNVTTAVNEAVFNMRTDLGSSLAGEVSAWSAITAGITAPVLAMELARAQSLANFGDATGMSNDQLSLLYEPKHPPIIIGNAGLGATLYLGWGGTVAVSGFAQAQIVVFPSSWATSVSL